MSSTSNETRPSNQELTNSVQEQQNTLRSLALQIADLEQKADEHILVLESLKEVAKRDPKRKSFRMVNKILVEAPVEEVIPSVQTNLDNLQIVLKSSLSQHKVKQDEHLAFQRKWNIQVVNR